MREVERIHDQMKKAFERGAWHGPSLVEVLDGVTAEKASAKPVPSAHSIWEIVLHLVGTQDLLLDRMRGVSRELTPEEDWPEVQEPSPGAWSAAVEALKQRDAEMREAVHSFADEQLEQPLVEGGSTAYDNLHGYVQHNLYHAGQIAILRK